MLHTCLLVWAKVGYPAARMLSHSSHPPSYPPLLAPLANHHSYLVGAIVLMAFAGVGLVAGIVAWIRHR